MSSCLFFHLVAVRVKEQNVSIQIIFSLINYSKVTLCVEESIQALNFQSKIIILFWQNEYYIKWAFFGMTEKCLCLWFPYMDLLFVSHSVHWATASAVPTAAACDGQREVERVTAVGRGRHDDSKSSALLDGPNEVVSAQLIVNTLIKPHCAAHTHACSKNTLARPGCMWGSTRSLWWCGASGWSMCVFSQKPDGTRTHVHEWGGGLFTRLFQSSGNYIWLKKFLVFNHIDIFS